MASTPMIGILGGGQLGRMLALAAQPMGVGVRLLDPAPGSSAAQVAPTLHGDFADAALLARFCEGLTAATYEWENVPQATAEAVAARVPVYPAPAVLGVAQDRLHQKQLCARLGIALPGFRAVDSLGDLRAAVAELGLPAVLKTRRDGYDGKGQCVLRAPEDVDTAWGAMGGVALVLEQFIGFDRELSLIAVRGRDGQTACYHLGQNSHARGILRLTVAPAPGLSPELQAEARAAAEALFTALDYVGVLSIEFFEHAGRLLVNEFATRVHNTGHWTIEGAETSQFENHMRAVLGWPLGSTRLRGHSAMLNVIGDWPPRDEVLQTSGAHWHDYGKAPRAARKLGHITLTAESEAALFKTLPTLRKLVETHANG